MASGSISGPGFIHLRAHSAFSLLEGALPLARLIELAVNDDQPALGLADRNNLFGALEFAEKAVGNGVQPIIGCTLSVAFPEDDQPEEEGQGDIFPIALIAQNEPGYLNLLKLMSVAYLEAGDEGDIAVSLAALSDHQAGLICLSGGREGPLDSYLLQQRNARADAVISGLAAIFADRFYVEIQRYNLPEHRSVERQIIDIAYRENLPLVATNQPFFAAAADYDAQDALMCIADGVVIAEPERRRLTPDHYFKTRSEMLVLFADLPEATANTIEIATRCAFRPTTRAPLLPRFTRSTGSVDHLQAESDELARQAREGLASWMADNELAPGTTADEYEERLEFELQVISRMQYPGYFLIVADFIKWAKNQDIPVGPGRGSGAGSLVALALTITALDPLRFSLLFERFLNPDRVSMPDFDIDFCQERRDEVIRYVQEKYGRDQVAQIITFGSLQARAVLRDVGRVLQMPYGQVDRLCKMVPNNPANPTTLAQAVEGEDRLRQAIAEEPIVEQLVTMSLKLEGLYRHASTHAAGIVIGDRPLDELVPMYRDPRSDMPVTQFNMKWVEPAGLVKFDFLGLKTLTVIEKTLALLRQRTLTIDIAHIPLDDAKTYEMLARGETVGVFQLESQGMRKAIIGMKPDRLEDVIALVALYRPGPMDNIPTYNARKHGDLEPDYLHEKLEPVLRETYGVIIYQEQVMQIAQILSGYSLGEADLLRRAMGKKIRAEMDKQRDRFVSGAVDGGIGRPRANEIFDLLAKFADYGFNKSHAAAYALVSYQTAYLKANYPVEFLAASMSLDLNNTDKLADFRGDALRLGIKVRPPSVQYSGSDFAVREGQILYALSAVKGVGSQAAEHIASARQQAGEFTSLTEFARSINPRLVNRRAMESMIAAGALDSLHEDRAALSAGCDLLLSEAARVIEATESGQSELFGEGNGLADIRLPSVTPWLPAEVLQREYQTIGFYFSAHPLDSYRPLLIKQRVQNWAEFELAVKQGASAGRLAGTVTAKTERRTRTGNRMGIVQLSDPTGQFEAVVFAEKLAQTREMLEPGNSVVLHVGAQDRPEGVSLNINRVETLDDIAEKNHGQMRIFLRDIGPLKPLASQLKGGGTGEVSFVLMPETADREVEVLLSGKFKINPQIQSACKSIPGVLDVELA